MGGCLDLYDAVELRDLECARRLLRLGHRPDVLGRRSVAPLHDAIMRGDVEILLLFLDGGADPNARDGDGWTALQHAVLACNAEVAEVLISYGARLELKGGEDGYTALHTVSQYCCPSVADVLLRHGASIHAANWRGETPLHVAECPEVAELLIAHGADVNARDADGQTPLHHAARRGDVAVVETLIRHGADVNARDRWGRTPLHMAAKYGRRKTAKLLVAYGATPDVRDAFGKTPADYATEEGCPWP